MFLEEDTTQYVASRLLDYFGRRTPWQRRLWNVGSVAWHRARVSNGPTEAVNNLVKRIKWVAFGITNFGNYRIRALLYAGKPNWNLLATLTPR